MAWAKILGAKVYAPMEIYQDESFQDDMLKSANKAANTKSIENLDIDTGIPKKSGLLINFNHPQTFECDAKIEFKTHKSENTEFVLPVATYAEGAGHLTNEDGIVQYSEQALFMNSPVPTVTEWLEKVTL